jgi:hypothetical protein
MLTAVLKDPDVESDSVSSVDPDSIPGSGSRKANNASEKKLREKISSFEKLDVLSNELGAFQGVWKSWRSKKKHYTSII